MMHVPRNGASAPATVGGRMTLGNVTRGKQARPIRALLHGVEGVGKSTFAANAPAPIFLCSEDGTSQLDVARFPTPRFWDEIGQGIHALTQEDHGFKTLVVDTLDWLEPLIWEHVCRAGGKSNIEDFGFGKGYVMAVDTWRSFLARLDNLVRTRKMNVILLAHSTVRKVDDPQTGAYDRYTLKVHEKSAAVLREWCDALLFARHEVVTVERKGKIRGVSSGARVIHTQWTAAYDAKNRYSLPETMPLDWEEFEAAVRSATPADAIKLRDEIVGLLDSLHPVEKAKAEKALREWAGEDAGRLAQLLDKVRAKVAIAGGTEPDAAQGGEGGAS